MSRPPFRYSADELHLIAGKLEKDAAPLRRELGKHLRLVADALSEIAAVDACRATPEQEAERINRVLRAFPGVSHG